MHKNDCSAYSTPLANGIEMAAVVNCSIVVTVRSHGDTSACTSPGICIPSLVIFLPLNLGVTQKMEGVWLAVDKYNSSEIVQNMFKEIIQSV